MMTMAPRTAGGRHSFRYGRRLIQYDLVYRDSERLAIHVHPDLRVTVKAPIGKAANDVARRVRRRAGWIVKQLVHFERLHPLPQTRQYVSGETHLYLGRQYRLKVMRSKREEVKLIGRYLRVYTLAPKNRGHIECLVVGWYSRHAEILLERRLSQCLNKVARVGISEPSMRFRRMKARWGSCSKSGTVTINTDVAKAPMHCIDYVIVHELCHLKHKNHSPAFWRLLSKLMPDWERRKRRLEEVLI